MSTLAMSASEEEEVIAEVIESMEPGPSIDLREEWSLTSQESVSSDFSLDFLAQKNIMTSRWTSRS